MNVSNEIDEIDEINVQFVFRLRSNKNVFILSMKCTSIYCTFLQACDKMMFIVEHLSLLLSNSFYKF